jgi:hypothetical protein
MLAMYHDFAKNTPHAIGVLICLGIIMMPGCGKTYRTAEVDGELMIHDEPGSNVRIQFVPDIDKATKGPISVAQTDSQGHFTLQLNEGDLSAAQPGAVIGWHRVALTDLRLSASSTGVGVPIRFGPEYALPASTPLRQEVKDEKQTIEIKLP